MGGGELQALLDEVLKASDRVIEDVDGGYAWESDVEVGGERRAKIEELLQESADGAIFEDWAAPLGSRWFSEWWCWRLKRRVMLVGLMNCWGIQPMVFSKYIGCHGLDVKSASSNTAKKAKAS